LYVRSFPTRRSSDLELFACTGMEQELAAEAAPTRGTWDQYFFLALLAGCPRGGRGFAPPPSPSSRTSRKSILRSSRLALSTTMRDRKSTRLNSSHVK